MCAEFEGSDGTDVNRIEWDGVYCTAVGGESDHSLPLKRCIYFTGTLNRICDCGQYKLYTNKRTTYIPAAAAALTSFFGTALPRTTTDLQCDVVQTRASTWRKKSGTTSTSLEKKNLSSLNAMMMMCCNSFFLQLFCRNTYVRYGLSRCVHCTGHGVYSQLKTCWRAAFGNRPTSRRSHRILKSSTTAYY